MKSQMKIEAEQDLCKSCKQSIKHTDAVWCSCGGFCNQECYEDYHHTI